MKAPGPSRNDQALTRKLAQLREMLLLEADLPEIWDYFQDFLASDEAFVDAGARDGRATLPNGFEDILKEFEPTGELKSSLVTRLDSHAMRHGCARWGRGYAFFFLFEDIEQGFCAYSGGLACAVIEFAQFAVPPHAHAHGQQTSAHAPS